MVSKLSDESRWVIFSRYLATRSASKVPGIAGLQRLRFVISTV